MYDACWILNSVSSRTLGPEETIFRKEEGKGLLYINCRPCQPREGNISWLIVQVNCQQAYGQLELAKININRSFMSKSSNYGPNTVFDTCCLSQNNQVLEGKWLLWVEMYSIHNQMNEVGPKPKNTLDWTLILLP